MRALGRWGAALALAAGLALAGPARAAGDDAAAVEVLDAWYRLTLELVRHTPTQSPPVAARAFGYLGVAAFEAAASGDPDLVSLAGQLNGLAPLPGRERDGDHAEAVVL